jgi:glycosyltransferase involved in cell wall biosynthesis
MVSVILPVHNAENTVMRAVDSVLKQTWQNIELIIMDDGSDDGSSGLIGKIWDERIRYQRMDHSGLVAVLNAGINMAAGRYIARMDADDWMHPQRIARQVEYLDQRPEIGLVSCLVRYIGDSRKFEGYARHVNWLNTILNHEDIYNQRFVESPMAHPSVMFRKTVVQQHGDYSAGPFPEDYELWLRWLDQGVKMAKTPEILLDWYDDAHRLSRIHPHYSENAIYQLKAYFFSQWYKSLSDDRQRRVLIWGQGSAVRRKSSWLGKYGIEISGYIDIRKGSMQTKDGQLPVYFYEDLPENHFILSYVGDRTGRKAIRKHLIGKGYAEGVDFYMMA